MPSIKLDQVPTALALRFMLLQTSWLSNDMGQNQADGERFPSVTEMPPPPKTQEE